MNQPKRKEAHPREEAAPFQTTNAHRLSPEPAARNSLLAVVGCHWDASSLERREMYLKALQADDLNESFSRHPFSEFDHATQCALLGAIVLRCREMWRHFYDAGFLG